MTNGMLIIDKAMEIRGAQYGIDARGRSTVGIGDSSYAGANDPSESTIIGSHYADRVIKITASNVVLDGLTVTSSYEYMEF